MFLNIPFGVPLVRVHVQERTRNKGCGQDKLNSIFSYREYANSIDSLHACMEAIPIRYCKLGKKELHLLAADWRVTRMASFRSTANLQSPVAAKGIPARTVRRGNRRW